MNPRLTMPPPEPKARPRPKREVHVYHHDHDYKTLAADLAEVLKEVEWRVNNEGYHECPECFNEKVHSNGCGIAAVLAKWDAVVE